MAKCQVGRSLVSHQCGLCRLLEANTAAAALIASYSPEAKTAAAKLAYVEVSALNKYPTEQADHDRMRSWKPHQGGHRRGEMGER